MLMTQQILFYICDIQYISTLCIIIIFAKNHARFHRSVFIVINQWKCKNILKNVYNFQFRMTKRSWFGALMGTEREEHHFVIVRDKPLSQVKADLVHAFLSVSEHILPHIVILRDKLSLRMTLFILSIDFQYSPEF